MNWNCIFIILSLCFGKTACVLSLSNYLHFLSSLTHSHTQTCLLAALCSTSGLISLSLAVAVLPSDVLPLIDPLTGFNLI